MKHSLLIILLFFLTGLSFHYDQSFFDFGQILLPHEFSIRSHFLFFFSLSYFLFFLFQTKSVDEETILFLTILIFFPSVYIYRFGIFDEILVFSFSFIYFLKNKNLKINIYLVLFVSFLLISSLFGLIYTVKSLRYIFQVVSIFFMGIQIYNSKTFLSDYVIDNLVYSAIFYYFFVLIGFFITFFNAPFLNLYLYGLGYSPTTFVNIPSLFVVPIFSFLYSNRRIGFNQYFIPTFLALIITILSDSRTGFLPFLLSIPILLPKFSFSKLVLFLFSIIIGAYLVGLYQFDNPFWLLDTASGLISIFEIGGTTTINYYGNVYDSSSGDTGRFTYIFMPFFFYVDNPLYIFSGVGVYGFYIHGFSYILELSKLLDSSVELVTSGLNLDGFLAIPRPPTFPSFILEYGIFLTFFVYFKILKKISLKKNYYFFTVFYFLVISSSFFLEIHESMFFYYLMFQKNLIYLFKQ